MASFRQGPDGTGKEHVVPAYSRNRVSDEFRQLADLAYAAFRANLSNLSADPSAVSAHDELLSRSCVYGYLYDRHFLHSPEMLLNELRWLRATHRPEPPRNAIHPQRFADHRNALLDVLIARFQNLTDYRDSLGPEAPEPAADPARTSAQRKAIAESVRQSSDKKGVPD
jgi:hypothetical protein